MEYGDELFKVCGAALLVVFTLSFLGKAPQGVNAALRAGGGVLVVGVLLVILRDNLEMIEGLLSLGAANSLVKDAFSLMLKALGVALLSRFCADICRDCGENTLANGVESVGKIVTVSLSLPLVSDILEKISQMSEL